ncbi:hypothetical protein RCL_jg16132.t1 [Rhizophagus clarus]|uniref:Uncharacterized protein n=1 Tax=Rhizophagus clarus TaxID=94130 RepID=A0A8H3QKU0_9GLOM|nr:hypothetical protein RCL_jg16132.t1 [Rhizophagus clarus]
MSEPLFERDKHFGHDPSETSQYNIIAALDNLMIILTDQQLAYSCLQKEADPLFTLKYFFLLNYQKVTKDAQLNQYETTLLNNGNWQTLKKIKNSKAVLDSLKSAPSIKTNNDSIHAVNNNDDPITYDAYLS